MMIIMCRWKPFCPQVSCRMLGTLYAVALGRYHVMASPKATNEEEVDTRIQYTSLVVRVRFPADAMIGIHYANLINHEIRLETSKDKYTKCDGRQRAGLT